MTEKYEIFALTVDQIKAIYNAGRDRGSDEATAYDWGSSASGHQYDNLVDCFHDILNEGKPFGDEFRFGWDEIERIFK